MRLNLSVLLFCFMMCIGKAVGNLRCYACTFSSVDSDRSCLTVTNSTRTVECPATYCTIMRQEYIDPRGEVASFTRGCEEEPDFLNHEVTDSTFRTYYRACTRDFCNVGDGIQPITGTGLSPRPVYTGDNLLVPGTGGSSAKLLQAKLIIALSVLFTVYVV